MCGLNVFNGWIQADRRSVKVVRGIEKEMSAYPNLWNEISGSKKARPSNGEASKANRRVALQKSLEHISRDILRLEKTRKETGLSSFEGGQLKKLRDRFILRAQEYYAIGGSPRDLR